MASEIREIRKPVEHEMAEFEKRFKKAMKSHVPLLNRITDFITLRKGKQIRPLFVLLSAKMFGPINDSGYVAASLVELMHTATLIHDDVVDDAMERRGFFSVQALWKKKAAVLIGDYLLARGLTMAIDNDEYRLLKIVSEAVKEMSEGELLQMEKSRKLNLTEEEYFKIIEQKTASLIAASCTAGAASAIDDEEILEKMHRFGMIAGSAFQVRDDIFDYSNHKIGKPTGNDIREKKLTLPVIHVLNTIDPTDKKKLLSEIRNHGGKKKNIQNIVNYVIEKGGVRYAEQKMQDLINQAEDILTSFPDNESRHALERLLVFLSVRTT